MIIYVFLLLLLFVATFLSKNRAFGSIVVIILLFLSMFRAETVGLDTINYCLFEKEEYGRGVKLYEFTFHFFYNLIPILGRYTVIYFFSITTFFFIRLASKRFEVPVSMTFFFFVLFVFYNLSLNIARQFASVSVLLYAYSFLYEADRKRLLFFPLVVLAGSIHAPAYGFVVIYFLKYLKLNNIKKIYIVILFAVLYYFINTFISSNFLEWANAFDRVGFESYSTYFAQADELGKASTNSMIISYGILFLNLLVLFNLIKIKDPKVMVVSSLFMVSIIVSLILDQFYGNLGRLKYDIVIINIIAYSYFLIKCNFKFKRITLIAIILFYGVSYIYNLSIGCYGTVPYKFIL